MDLAGIKNEIKIIFYIINSFIWLIPGNILLGFGISVWATNYTGIGIGLIAGGMVGVGIATLGFGAAILEHKMMLIAYSVAMSLVTIINFITCLAMNVGSYRFDTVWLGISLTHLSLVLIAVSLSVTQVRLIRQRTEQGTIIGPAPTSTSTLLENTI